MPILQVHFLEGRTREQKRALVQRLTEVVCETMAVHPEQVRIILSEMPRDTYAIAGELVADRPS